MATDSIAKALGNNRLSHSFWSFQNTPPSNLPFWKAVHRNNLFNLIFAILLACPAGMPLMLAFNVDYYYEILY